MTARDLHLSLLSCREQRHHRVINRRRTLILTSAEQVRTGAQGDCRRAVSKAFADLDDVDAGIDQVRGVRVPERMEGDLGRVNAGRRRYR
jgi:hypothetical protein